MNNAFLPVGISIFVFQQIAILIEAHRKNLLDLNISQFLVVSFFWGNFATGPILFGNNFKQFGAPISFSKKNINGAVIHILFGAFKIYVVSGHLSLLTRELFRPLNAGQNYLIPFLANKYEIFANFSGYTDLAIGVGLLFGIKFPENFNRPFSKASIIEFWKRWHMSLTEWIKNYIFFPLLSTRLSSLGIYFLMLFTFGVFALWHGLKLVYFLYAFIQVLLIFLNHQWRKIFPSKKEIPLIKFLQWAWFYLILISIPGVLFKSANITQFISIIVNISETHFNFFWTYINEHVVALAISLFSIAVVEIIQLLTLEKINTKFSNLTLWKKWIVLSFFIFVILILGNFKQNINFVYSAF